VYAIRANKAKIGAVSHNNSDFHNGKLMYIGRFSAARDATKLQSKPHFPSKSNHFLTRFPLIFAKSISNLYRVQEIRAILSSDVRFATNSPEETPDE
jgi:hypothetical protein